MARRWLSRGAGRQAGARAPAVPPPPPVTTPDDYYSDARIRVCCACHAVKPPPLLDGLDDAVMIAVAAVPGKILEEWQPAAPGAWIAWPDAEGAEHAEVMTAGQLRTLPALLAGRGDG